MNHILREIKLSKFTDTPLSNDASKLINFWVDLWIDMKIYIDADKGEIKCWKDGYNYYYFQQDDKNDNLWCNHYKVWSFFREELVLSYDDAKDLIHSMMNEIIMCKVNTPRSVTITTINKLNDTLNNTTVTIPPNYLNEK